MNRQPDNRRPIVGVIAVVARKDSVLLVQRRNEPDAGLWGFPGGKVEWGESVLDAASRELREETGVEACPVEMLSTFDVIFREDDQVMHHFVMIAVLCEWSSGEPVAADDAMDAAWIELADIASGQYATSERVLEVARMVLKRR